MAPKKKTPQKPPPKEPFLIRSHTLTPSTETTLHQLSQDASDVLGWSVSKSAVIRALLRYLATQPPTWARDNLFSYIERELEEGTVWGKRSELVTQKKHGQ